MKLLDQAPENLFAHLSLGSSGSAGSGGLDSSSNSIVPSRGNGVGDLHTPLQQSQQRCQDDSNSKYAPQQYHQPNQNPQSFYHQQQHYPPQMSATSSQMIQPGVVEFSSAYYGSNGYETLNSVQNGFISNMDTSSSNPRHCVNNNHHRQSANHSPYGEPDVKVVATDGASAGGDYLAEDAVNCDPTLKRQPHSDQHHHHSLQQQTYVVPLHKTSLNGSEPGSPLVLTPMPMVANTYYEEYSRWFFVSYKNGSSVLYTYFCSLVTYLKFCHSGKSLIYECCAFFIC